MSNVKDFAGMVAIITGGGTGLGKAMAMELGGRGASIVIASRKRDVLDAAAAEISAATGAQVLVVSTDVTDLAQVEALMSQTMDTFGRIDILVNNAAGNKAKPLELTHPKSTEKIMSIVAGGARNCTYAVVPYMKKQGGGQILNILTDYAGRGAPGMTASAEAKSALLSATKTASVELGHYGIRVNGFVPGTMLTKNASENIGFDDPEMQQKIIDRTPLGRLTSAEEMAKPAVALLTDAFAYRTGDVTTVDGGFGLNRALLDYNDFTKPPKPQPSIHYTPPSGYPPPLDAPDYSSDPDKPNDSGDPDKSE